MSERETVDKTPSAIIARRNESRTIYGGASSPAAAIARDAVDGVSCRVGDASCAGAHASTISRSMRIDTASAQRSLLKLQMRYGNQFVGRVIDRAANGEAPAGDMSEIERSIESSRGGGGAMDQSTRARMETAFGADFSGVRIHHDAHSDGLSRSLSARAFATGQDVYFRQGEYNPGTSGGRELLAHELTHVVQQTGGIQRKMSVSQPNDPHEVEADQMAHAVMRQDQSGELDGQTVARAEEEKDKDRHLAMKADAGVMMRQPEAPGPHDEEEKKKLHAKLDAQTLARAQDDELPE
ncbi:Protein of unknown function (DUF4157) (plasmid) [Paraburkholderia caribensis MBA4]|uniref:eCIS core domain-containing protein n=1 Tax=Paraburkholderia caribensis MBA4 TaxID=1323664 RepID=A0A0N7JW38_9BURK|nr:DUF4157 domain-containing protein [Paraburkholderia caribensis]ALL70933.1 Protein of unknown function (DUF4157) [Paraburkholderia caribensis MBA4]